MKANNFLYIVLLSSLLLLLHTGCKKEHSPASSVQCDTTNTDFNQLYGSILAVPGNTEGISQDFSVHAYTFQVTSAKTICKIGYQNSSPTNTQPYLVELYDSTTNTLLYSGNEIFSTGSTSYISITPVSLVPGKSYTIRRTQNFVTANDVIGRVILNQNNHIVFPVTFGSLKITSSAFSVTPDWSDNMAFPYIDLVFQ